MPKQSSAEPAQEPVNNQWWIPLVLVAFTVYYLVSIVAVSRPEEISYSDFVAQVESRQVESVLIRGRDIRGRYQAGGSDVGDRQEYHFHVVIPEMEGQQLLALLVDHGVDIEVRADEAPVWLQLLAGFLPWLLIIGFFVWSSRALRERMGGAGGMYGFGRSRARRHESRTDGLRFADEIGRAHV